MNSFHNNFSLNGVSFNNEEALLIYCKTFSEPVFLFLKDWFNVNDFIEVQTSGSTGKPKLIKLKKEHMKNSAIATGEFFNLKNNTTALVCLSTEYIAGKMMLIRALTLGWCIDIVEAVSKPLTKTKKDYDFAAMVPMQLQNSLSEIHRVKKLIVGGGVVSKTLVGQIQNIKTKIYATYGMTETITHIAVKKLNGFNKEENSKNNSFYQVLPNVSIDIDSRDCLVISAFKVSEELVVTNDVVQLISKNQFEWLGRFDNVINSGGIKLYPEKIEEKLAKVIASRFFVIGVTDNVLGEKLILLIEGGFLDFEISKANLLKFEVPKEVFFLDKFIDTETKKIQRKKTLDLLKL